MTQNYMLDTNVFSELVHKGLTLNDLPQDGQFWATPVQLTELNHAKPNLRARLSALFKEMIVRNNRNIPPAFAFGVEGAGFDQGQWGGDAALWDAIKRDLDDAWDRKPNRQKKKSKRENNLQDASIAEAAKSNNFTLITCDKAFDAVGRKHGIKVLLLTLHKTSSVTQN